MQFIEEIVAIGIIFLIFLSIKALNLAVKIKAMGDEADKLIAESHQLKKIISDQEGVIQKSNDELAKSNSQVLYFQDKFGSIIDIEKEKSTLKTKKENLQSEIDSLNKIFEESKKNHDSKLLSLKNVYLEKKNIFDDLLKQISIYDEDVQLAELGLYKPHFNFDSSEKYKEEINSVKSEQKKMVSSKEAILCPVKWHVNGSTRQGTTMLNRLVKLSTRAFNNECEAAISFVRWNNAKKMEIRIENAFNAINKFNKTYEIEITKKYFLLKLKELRLTHEYAEKKKKEKEEQQEIKRRMREESKLEKEMEQAFKEEEKLSKLLDKARTDAEKAVGDKLEALNKKVASLTTELEDAHSKSERALSMAQQTKIGHVYIVSNIGSFGDNVYKIGMTRRLEPIDRVKELSGASVPFTFDVHAMIYSDDAPHMENSLHKAFSNYRVNLVNMRKEFFNVSLQDIKNEVSKISKNAEFIETAEAQQYRETQMIIAERDRVNSEAENIAFPETI